MSKLFGLSEKAISAISKRKVSSVSLKSSDFDEVDDEDNLFENYYITDDEDESDGECEVESAKSNVLRFNAG